MKSSTTLRTLMSWLLAPALALGPGALAVPATGLPHFQGGNGQIIDGKTRLFYGGIFHTGSGLDDDDGSGPPRAWERTVEALLVRDGRILALGNASDLAESDDAEGAERIDMAGAHCYPGLQDSHGYLEELGASLEEVDLTGAASYAELVARVVEYAASLPQGQWIRGRGWDQTLWEGGEYPAHAALSKAVPTHPVLVLHADGDVGLANEVAMDAAKITDEAHRATGIFTGADLDEIEMAAPMPARTVRRRRILRAQEALLPLGLTAVHDMALDRGAVEILAELRDSGTLKLRVVGYLNSQELAQSLGDERIAALADRHDVFSIVGVSYHLDGGFGSRGAALLGPYADAPETRGYLRWNTQDLSTSVEAVARMGLQPSVRATGDRGVRVALTAFAHAAQRFEGFTVFAPRIEHMQLVTQQDLDALADLGVVPSMQPMRLISDLAWLKARLGDERVQDAFAWQTVRSRASQRLAFGSAFPMGPPDPRSGLYAAVTRQTFQGKPEGGFRPSQRLEPGAALSAYTKGAAAAGLQDDRRGQLALGYAADFTAFDLDLLELFPTSAPRLLEANVMATVINGQVVYRRP